MLELKASQWLPARLISAILLILILCVELYIGTERRSSKNKTITRRLMLLLLVSWTIFALIGTADSFFCMHCVATTTVRDNLGIVAKITNQAFFVHRAKLAQGLSPVLPAKCFEKILPAILLTVCIGSMGFVSYTQNLE